MNPGQKPSVRVPDFTSSDNALSACPKVEVNDSEYKVNDSRACVGSGVIAVQPNLDVAITRPAVR